MAEPATPVVPMIQLFEQDKTQGYCDPVTGLCITAPEDAAAPGAGPGEGEAGGQQDPSRSVGADAAR